MRHEDTPPPTAQQADSIERFAEALYELLRERALSWGLLDIGLEVDDWFVDGELMFATGPDMGFSLNLAVGAGRVCELIGTDHERWLEATIDDLRLPEPGDADSLRAQVLSVLDGVLDARRPLLRSQSTE